MRIQAKHAEFVTNDAWIQRKREVVPLAKIHSSFSELERRAQFANARSAKMGAILFVGGLLTVSVQVFYLMLAFGNGYFQSDFLEAVSYGLSEMMYWFFDIETHGMFMTSGLSIVPDKLTLAYFVLLPLGLCVALLGLAFFLLLLCLAAFWPLMLGCALLAYPFREHAAAEEVYGRLHAGVTGEATALQLARRLPDSCHVFTNRYIFYQGKRSETDMIVVGPGGVAVVEVKYWSGLVEGNADENVLTREKKGNRSQADNPAMQVKTHVFRLAGYLRSKGESVEVMPFVLFSHPEVRMNIQRTQPPKQRGKNAATTRDAAAARQPVVHFMTQVGFDVFVKQMSRGPLSAERVERIAALIGETPQSACPSTQC